MRIPHYWKGSSRTAAPSEIVCFDTETRAGPESSVPGGEFHTLRLGVATAYRLERGRRTREAHLEFTKGDELWGFITGRLSKNRPVWVFGHNLAYDVAAAGLWQHLESDLFECEKAVVEGGVLLIEGDYGGRRIVFCDTFNYYKCSLSSIGASLGLAKMTMPPWSAPDRDWYEYCRRDVEVTALAVDKLIAFVRENELGPWQPTIASLAFSALRRRFLRHKVLVHCYEKPLRLERSAYYGGIVDTPFIGRVPAEPVHELDVCSMYPSVCEGTLPTVFKGYEEGPSPARLADLAGRFYCFADVTLRARHATYPVRRGHRVLYARGNFRTALPHPELLAALNSGDVGEVHAVSWYDSAPVFKDYMNYFVSQKEAYRKAGNEAFATISKYYANSLYGKCGQMSPRWAAWGEEAFGLLERREGLPAGSLSFLAGTPPPMASFAETFSVADFGLTFEIRHLFGMVEVRVDRVESRDSCPAVAAAVTSAARVRLRRLQATAGAGHYFYSDTDSIWVDDTGLARLDDAGEIRPGALGFLTHVATHGRLTVYGPKDYATDRVEKIKGVRKSAGVMADGSYVQLQFPSAKSMLLGGDKGGVMVKLVVKRLTRRVTHCDVGPDGWTSPLALDD